MENREVLRKQIEDIIPDIGEALLKEVDHVVACGSLSEEDYERFLNGGESFALAKAIVSAWFETKPYAPRFNKELASLQRRISRI